MKKVLILVMSSRKQPYRDMQETSFTTWDKEEVFGVETFYYHGSSEHFAHDSVAAICNQHLFQEIYFPVKETLTAVSEKTKLAFEWALKKPDWDFIFRANASTYVDKKTLHNYVQDKPGNYFAGLPAPLEHGRYFMWGVCYLISRDLVELSVSSPWNMSLMDDNALSLTLEGKTEFRNGRLTTIHKRENDYQVLTYDEGTGGGFETDKLSLIEGQYAYRCKQDGRRDVDCQIMRDLWKSKQK